MNAVIGKLKDSGIPRDELYTAWDFTVASTQNITDRMLLIRDHALAQLGDTSPGNGVIDGVAPNYTITDVKTSNFPTDPLGSHASRERARGDRHGRGPVLHPPRMRGATAGRSPRADGLPTQRAGRDRLQRALHLQHPALRRHRVEPGATDYDVTSPVRPSMYGHGLFGDYTEVHTGDVRKLGNDHGVITCATDFIGMYEDDVGPEAIPALQDMSNFTPMPDRLQQGLLDFIYLGRLLMRTPTASPTTRPSSSTATRRSTTARALLLRQHPGRDRRRRPDRDRAGHHPHRPLRPGDELLAAADPQHRLRGLRADPLPVLPGRVARGRCCCR